MNRNLRFVRKNGVLVLTLGDRTLKDLGDLPKEAGDVAGVHGDGRDLARKAHHFQIRSGIRGTPQNMRTLKMRFK
jgi:hypothetical protein